MGKYVGSDGLSAVAAKAKQRDIVGMSIDGTTLTLTKGDGTTLTDTIPQKTYTAGTGIAISNSDVISITGTPLNYKGSCAVADLPSSSTAQIGDMWNITDTSTYGPAGTNVAWNGTTWDAMGGIVDIPIESIAGTAPITSTINGTTATIAISAASTSAAGSMSAADKTKLDGVATGAQVNVIETVTGTAPISVTSSGKTRTVAISAATTTAAGSMSAADKTKLDGIEEGANAYVLPQATDQILGGVKVDKSTIIIDSETGQISATNNGTITGVTAGTNLTGGGTSGAVTISHAGSGVTAGSKGDTTNQTPAFGGTFNVTSGTVDAQGHLTAFASHTVKIPDTVASTTVNGLMTIAMVTKLNGVATGATADTEMTTAEAEAIWDAA